MGEVFGRYELLRRLGTGGMAEVFAAKTFGAEGFVKEVVIKRILPTFSEDLDFVQMFINEATLAAKLQHTNIVQIFDFNHFRGVYYIAMEWVDGPDLRRVWQIAQRRAMPIPRRLAVHVGVEALKGLHYAHSKNDGGQPLRLVHRDISPHNLLISFSGEVKITDFGIAKAAALASATRSGAVKGKLAYMSPEQVELRPLDGRTDLFSLGIVLWELLAGRRLYRGESEAEIYTRVKQAEIPALGEIVPDLEQGLEGVVMRLLAPAVEERYGSALEALGELSRYAEVGDSLEAASYLGQLMPAESGPELKGNTVIQGEVWRSAPLFARAAADVPTRTVDDEREAALPGPAAEPQGLHLQTTLELETAPTASFDSDLATGREVSHDEGLPAPPLAVEDQAASSSLRRLLIFGACFLACGLLGWWLVGKLDRAAVPVAEVPFSTLRVESKPSGASLLVEDIEVGVTPCTLEGPQGARLKLQARLGGLGERREWVMARPLEKLLMVLAAPIESGSSGVPQDAPVQPPDLGVAADAAASPGSSRPPAKRVSEREVVREGPVDRRPVARKGKKAGRASKARPGGVLNVVVFPWARVKIDGEDLGQTPIRRHRLPPGSYWIDLSNSELKKSDRIKIRMTPGKEIQIRRTWVD